MHMILQFMHTGYISKLTEREAQRWLFLTIESSIQVSINVIILEKDCIIW